ncbi:MAG: HAMP domain-containing protein [Gammaproteobacteria bacterium]|nr:HAMP domain-containing protein [Gammaproteobacteria bacterium]
MSGRLLRSSSFRLALVYMLLFSASVLILLGFIYWSTSTYMAEQTDATIEAEIAGLAERYELDGLPGLLDSIKERVSRRPVGLSVCLLATSTYAPLAGNLDRWPDIAEDDRGWIDFQIEGAGGEAGEKHRARARSFRLQGGFRLLVGRDIHELEDTRRTIVRALVWGLLVTVVLAVAGGAMISRSTIRRLETINAASREIMSGDLSRRIPTRGTGDDFDVLADNLNAMLSRIQTLMEDVARVSDNISHDLRTPLARLRNDLQDLLAGSPLDIRWRDRAEQALEEADGILSTFNSLMRIARIESSAQRANFTELDLDRLARDVVELYEPLAEEKGQTLMVDTVPDTRVTGDRDLLFQAIANLLDNAIKYTPGGGRIDVALDDSDGGPRLIVADNGPGVPEGERSEVFKRFYRCERSRTTSGNGLGLSLVAAAAKIHDIEVSLEDNHPGLRVVCRFTRVD